MSEFGFKYPTSKEDMEKLRKQLRQEISEDDLDAIVGGNDDKNKKKKDKTGFPFTCEFCGASMVIYQFEDVGKHMTKCPNNPYK
ncbi:MAG: hypothetical protein IKN04_05160 [Clostridia bacterium]|nr:hypothetical protein [Clostridia bacterium]